MDSGTALLTPERGMLKPEGSPIMTGAGRKRQRGGRGWMRP